MPLLWYFTPRLHCATGVCRPGDRATSRRSRSTITSGGGGGDGERLAADRAVVDPAHRLGHVAVAAVQPAALEALAGRAVVVLVLGSDWARVLRIVGVACSTSSQCPWWAP